MLDCETVSAWRAGSVSYFSISSACDLLGSENIVLLIEKGKKYVLLKCRRHTKTPFCKDLHTHYNGVHL